MAVAAAGYIINDYYDVKIDYINEPDRVVIGKNITRRFAILFHVLLSLLGILIGAYLSWSVTALNVVSVFLLWLYSNSLKRLPFVGNLTVALLTGAAVYSVDILYRSGNALIGVYAVFAMFITLVREIIKDIEDLKGDNTFGCRPANRMGYPPHETCLVPDRNCVFSCRGFIELSIPRTSLPISTYLSLRAAAHPVWKLIRADTKLDFMYLSTLCKVIMLMGIASMAFV